jgi:hypothetical protein
MGILIPKRLMSPFSRTNRKRNAQVSSLSPALSIKKDKRHEMAHIFATQKTQKSQNPKRATQKNQNPFWRHPTELAPHRRPATPVARVGLGATPKTRGCRPKAPAKKNKKINAPQKTKKEGASSSVPVVEAKRRRAGPSKYPRKPRYWGDQIQALDTAARSAARHLVEIAHQGPRIVFEKKDSSPQAGSKIFPSLLTRSSSARATRSPPPLPPAHCTLGVVDAPCATDYALSL